MKTFTIPITSSNCLAIILILLFVSGIIVTYNGIPGYLEYLNNPVYHYFSGSEMMLGGIMIIISVVAGFVFYIGYLIEYLPSIRFKDRSVKSS